MEDTNPVSNVQTPSHKFQVLLVTLVVLLSLSLSLSVFLYYQNQQLQKQIAKLSIQPSPTSITDPTANWKTYSSTDTDFTFSYPSDFDNIKQNKLAKNSVSLTAKNGDSFSVSILSGGIGIECQEMIEENEINIDGIKATMTSLAGITNDNCDTGGKKSFMATFQKDKLYYLLDYTYSTDNKKDNKSIFDHILSTFKFIDDLKLYSDNIVQFKYPSSLTLKEGRLTLNNSSIEIFSSKNLVTECMEFISNDERFGVNLKRFKKAIGGDFCGIDNSDRRETWVTKEKESYGPGLMIYYSLKDEEQLNNILNTILPTLKFTP